MQIAITMSMQTFGVLLRRLLAEKVSLFYACNLVTVQNGEVGKGASCLLFAYHRRANSIKFDVGRGIGNRRGVI